MLSGMVGGDAEVVERFRAMPYALRTRIRESITRSVLRVQRKVKQEKLSGGVLNVRTGTLRRSIDQVVVDEGNAVVGIVSTNVKYGRRFEYGFSGAEAVKEHLRLVKQAWGKELRSPVWSTVRQHSRHVNVPEKSFLRSSLRELKGEIVADLQKSVVRAAVGGAV